MKFLDIDFPLSEYRKYASLRNFTFVVPADSPLADNVNLNTMVKLVGWNEKYFMKMWNSDEGLPDDKTGADAFVFYDIAYIKNCCVRNVAPFEWDVNWGPNSLDDWVDFVESDDLGAEVRVICLVRPTADLRSLVEGGYLNAGQAEL